jgi:hypothetical protein
MDASIASSCSGGLGVGETPGWCASGFRAAPLLSGKTTVAAAVTAGCAGAQRTCANNADINNHRPTTMAPVRGPHPFCKPGWDAPKCGGACASAVYRLSAALKLSFDPADYTAWPSSRRVSTHCGGSHIWPSSGVRSTWKSHRPTTRVRTGLISRGTHAMILRHLVRRHR